MDPILLFNTVFNRLFIEIFFHSCISQFSAIRCRFQFNFKSGDWGFKWSCCYGSFLHFAIQFVVVFNLILNPATGVLEWGMELLWHIIEQQFLYNGCCVFWIVVLLKVAPFRQTHFGYRFLQIIFQNIQIDILIHWLLSQ